MTITVRISLLIFLLLPHVGCASVASPVLPALVQQAMDDKRAAAMGDAGALRLALPSQFGVSYYELEPAVPQDNVCVASGRKTFYFLPQRGANPESLGMVLFAFASGPSGRCEVLHLPAVELKEGMRSHAARVVELVLRAESCMEKPSCDGYWNEHLTDLAPLAPYALTYWDDARNAYAIELFDAQFGQSVLALYQNLSDGAPQELESGFVGE